MTSRSTVVEEHKETTASPKAGTNVRIVATVHQIEDDESFNVVEFPTLSGATKSLRIPRELFRTPTKVADQLVKASADLSSPLQAIKTACAAAEAQRPAHIELTRRTGWHGDSFVYPNETFGSLSSHLYDAHDAINPALGMRNGSLAAWRKGLRDPCKFSDYLLFTLSVGPASCLLDIIGQDEGAIFHLHGTNPTKTTKEKTRSTSGKTMVTRAGISTIGRCRKTDLFSFAITERAIEDFCFSHNHLAVALDEEGRSSDGGSKTRVKTVYLPYIIPGGRGAVRSNKATQDRNLKNLSWALLALSTGEYPLDGPSTVQRPEGAQVRMIGIPVSPGKNGGVFNRVVGTSDDVSKTCIRLARQVESTIAENFGVAMPKYLREVVPRRSTLDDRVRQIIDKFVNKVGAATDPWERRFAEKFGIVLAGAILMSECKVGPWTKKRARSAISTLYNTARSTTVTTSDATDAVLVRLRKLVTGGKRFPMLKKGTVLDTSKSWGAVRKLANGKETVIIRLSRFKKLVISPAMTSPILAELAARGILIKGQDGKNTRQMMISGMSKRRRYICLDRKRLF